MLVQGCHSPLKRRMAGSYRLTVGSSSPSSVKNQSYCRREKQTKFSRIQTSIYTEIKGKWSYLLNESLNNLVLIRHVRDHVRHVVFRGSDKGWAKHNGQVTWLHLINTKKKKSLVKKAFNSFLFYLQEKLLASHNKQHCSFNDLLRIT